MKMKKCVSAVLAVVFSVLFFAALASVCVSADSSDIFPLHIDDMSRLTSDISADRATVSKGRYTPENIHLATNEKDSGFIVTRRDTYTSGDTLSLTKAFSLPVNLYGYAEFVFDYKLAVMLPADSVTDVENIHYSLIVTLRSDENEFVTRLPAEGGGWQTASVPISAWHNRTNITEVTIAVSAAYDSGERIALLMSLDRIRADTPADTTVPDTFMTESFSTMGGGSVYIREKNIIEWALTAPASSITGIAAYENRAAVKDHSHFRVALNSTADISLKLLVSYKDGTGIIGDAVEITAQNKITSLYFELPDADKVSTFTLSAEGGIGTVIGIYSIDTLKLTEKDPSAEAPLTGTLDICSVKSDGSINLRGTVPADTVSANLSGKLTVYALPIYEDFEPDSAILLAEADMTTRYNITVPKSKLPDGAAAMIYTVILSNGDEKIQIGEPRMPRSDGAGVTVPNRSKSIKGLALPNLTAADSAGVTEITVDLSRLFDRSTSGRIHSAFGRLFYFNTDYLKELDAKIKSVSLSSTDVYIRLVSSITDASGKITGYNAILADTKEDFESTAAAVDFITQRYSSPDYGYICGIILGNSVNDERNAESPDEYAASIVRAAAAVYGIGSANIADMRLLLPFGDVLTEPIAEAYGDTKLLLSLISEYAKDHRLSSYGIIWQTSSSAGEHSIGVDSISELKAYTSTLGEYAPSYIFVEYTVKAYYFDSAAMLSDYVKTYYKVCAEPSVTSFIYKFSATPDASVWSGFISYFPMIDTDLSYLVTDHIEALTGTSLSIPEAAKSRAHPYSYSESKAVNRTPAGITGTYELFGYKASFDTGGWFSADKSGECATVKVESGRAMKAVGTVMYSAITPIDLSASPVIAIDSYADRLSEYELILYSKNGIFKASFSSSGRAVSYIDLSEYAGISSIYGIVIKPTLGNSTLYIKSISVKSYTESDSELSDIYLSASVGEAPGAEPEEKLVEILAISFVAVALSALALALLRRKE